MKLSIVIPAYNAEPYIYELTERLNPQICDDIEVLIVDDGSKKPYKPRYKWEKVIRQKNKGLAGARNTGIENTSGEYLHFIDADDLVPEYYVEYILNLIETESPDFIELSWKSFDEPEGGVKFDFKLNKNDSLPNPSACTRIYKRTFLGDMRFNEKKDTAEDEDLFRRMDFSKGKKAVATDYMYFYRTSTPNSLSKKYRRGETHTKRLVYYFSRITADMTWLIDEVKKECEVNEVVIMTRVNNLPEIEKYATVMVPCGTYAHELRGEYTNLVRVVQEPIKAQVIIYTHDTYKIGGIETFIFNFCNQLKKYYDILVLYDIMDTEQISRLIPLVPVQQLDRDKTYICDSLILNRLQDKIPENISYGQSIQMVHGCRDAVSYEINIPKDRDHILCVSEVSKESFGEQAEKAEVMHNLTYKQKADDMLFLVSATRLSTNEKGNARMVKFANRLKAQGIKFVWICFADGALNRSAPPEIIRLDPTLNIISYIKAADYLVQLSDTEGFGYSIVEALEQGTPVIVSDLPVLPEIGVKDGENGYIVPFEVDDFDMRKLLKIPKFKYTYDNKTLVDKWRKLLGNTTPTHSYKPGKLVKVRITQTYTDMVLDRLMVPGEVVNMTPDRAKLISEAGYGEEV